MSHELGLKFEILSSFSGIAVLAAACFFGYMLALLQRRIAIILSHDTVSTNLLSRSIVD